MPITCKPGLCELSLVLDPLVFESLAHVSLTLSRLAFRNPDEQDSFERGPCERLAFVCQAAVSLPL